MSRIAALLAYCLCCATIAMASNPDQWTGATTPEKVTATQIATQGDLRADGGLSLGLAFLSDIQVQMFLEAAQRDRRSNVMQAPKQTMFNGPSAGLRVQDKPTEPSTH